MSKESFLLFTGGILVIGVMAYFYLNNNMQIKGSVKKAAVSDAPKNSAPSEKNNINNDANIQQPESITDTPAQAPKKSLLSSSANKMEFISFEDWPGAQNTDSNQAELNKIPKSGKAAMTPQSVLDDEFKSTTELYKGLSNQLSRQTLNVTEYNNRIRKLQSEYDEKIKALFQKKQKLTSIQKLIDNGSVSSNEGGMMMWKLVLPPETVKAMSSLPKPMPGQTSFAPAAPAQGTVTGIMFNTEDPSVLIDGEIYKQGASVHNVRIAKINNDTVEFVYNGLSWSQAVNDAPSPNWP